ncbi:hypothetical protein H9Y05_03850 [Crocinitomicaceae bacterium CZZ-1]|uniref:AlgX/AlgJ SGNH hydrolase-like domain-containing protein n=1 Tax=Taishania pollutisoli TaxID=2766479 RepID=A0A8J6PHC5_9FLAO|nr:hypothetical protein [Taishania pollutisoli]MBC9811601.1 hypothetical protein [Taishania pollutisoli]
MKKYTGHIKNGLFLVVLVLLFLPMLQSKFRIVNIQPLKGAVQATADPYISGSNWLSGEYQRLQEQYVKDSFGLREPFVRLYNQLNFSMYNQTNAEGIVIGKEGYLYEEGYIRAYLGLDFVGEDSIRKKVEQLKVIADSLEKEGIEVVVLLAPGKGSFYPEYFPESYNGIKKGKTNFEVYKKYLTSEGINVFDAHTWFAEMKHGVHQQNKLYSKTGIHWSKYGEYLVADSLLAYLTQVTGRPFPGIELDHIEYTSKLRDTDNDIWQGMNLIRPLEDFKMAYPVFHRTEEEHNRTRVVTISDSYFWGLYWMGLPKDYFADGEFWYYMEQRYPQSFTTSALVDKANLAREIEKNNVVLLICTESNLPRFGFGLIESFFK